MYASLDGGVTRITGASGATSGFEFALLLDHRLAIGIAGYGLVSGSIPLQVGGRTHPDTLRFGYGGIRLAYTIAPAAALHAGFEVLMGGGEASTRVNGGPDLEDDEMFVLVPGITSRRASPVRCD